MYEDSPALTGVGKTSASRSIVSASPLIINFYSRVCNSKGQRGQMSSSLPFLSLSSFITVQKYFLKDIICIYYTLWGQNHFHVSTGHPLNLVSAGNILALVFGTRHPTSFCKVLASDPGSSMSSRSPGSSSRGGGGEGVFRNKGMQGTAVVPGHRCF